MPAQQQAVDVSCYLFVSPRHMKGLKSTLAIIGLLIFMSFLVIGTFRFSSITYPALLVLVPIITFRVLRSDLSPIFKIVGSIAGIVCLFYLLIFLAQFVLCGYSVRQNEYVNRKNKKITIVGRDFSCFGTTGDLILYKHYSVAANIGLEFYYKTCPEYKNINIDSAIWQRAEK